MSTETTQRTVKLGVLVTLVMLVFVLIVGIDAYQKLRRQPGPPSTYNARSAGYKALYLWLHEMGVPANRWESPLTELRQEAEVLLILSPRFGPGPGELKALDNWVRGGGTLVLVASQGNAFAEHFDLNMKRGLPDRKKPDGKGTQSFQPGPYIRGQRTITAKTHPDIESKKPQSISHIMDAFGNLIMVSEEGKGRVIMIADPSLFSNFHLRDGDHARLALDLLLTHLGDGPLLIDEYHHGYGRVSSVAAYVFQSEAFIPLIQAGFLFLLIWGAAGRRFGPARSVSRETERSSMEYVRAMAHLFQRVKARRLSLESVLRWFDEEARRLLLDKDPGYQGNVAEAKKQLALERMTDRDLVNVVRNLYEALSRARNKALGVSARKNQ
ncbi:MAG: DUF4350 domain-containing protein [Deltaproteobacteria bacterium]